MKLFRTISSCVAFVGLLTLSAVAFAQNAPMPGPQGPGGMHARPNLAPAHTQGTILRYVVGPMGHVRGLVLNNGAVAMLPRGAGDALAQSTPIGTAVTVQGMANPATPNTIFHATVMGPNGAVLAAPPAGMGPHAGGMAPPAGPNAAPGAPGGFRGRFHHGGGMHRGGMGGGMFNARAQMLSQLTARSGSGSIVAVLSGPHGRPHGLVLSDGTSAFFAHGITQQLAQRTLRNGENVRVSGRGSATAYGTSVLVEELTLSDGTILRAPLTAPQMQPTP